LILYLNFQVALLVLFVVKVSGLVRKYTMRILYS